MIVTRIETKKLPGIKINQNYLKWDGDELSMKDWAISEVEMSAFLNELEVLAESGVEAEIYAVDELDFEHVRWIIKDGAVIKQFGEVKFPEIGVRVIFVDTSDKEIDALTGQSLGIKDFVDKVKALPEDDYLIIEFELHGIRLKLVKLEDMDTVFLSKSICFFSLDLKDIDLKDLDRIIDETTKELKMCELNKELLVEFAG